MEIFVRHHVLTRLCLSILMTVALPAVAAEPKSSAPKPAAAAVEPVQTDALKSTVELEASAQEIQGRYGRIELSGVFPNATRGKDFPHGAAPQASIAAQTGIGFGAAIGYQFDNIFALELALNHRFFTVKGNYISTEPRGEDPGEFPVEYRSHVNSVSLMPTLRVGWDAYKDIRVTGSFGMGISNNTTGTRESHQPNNHYGWTAPYENGDYWNHGGMSWTNFVWSMGIGGEYRLTDKLFLTSDLNYVDLGTMHWSERWKSMITGEVGAELVQTPYRIKTMEMRVGLGYRF